MKWIFTLIFPPKPPQDEWEVAWQKLYAKRIQRDAELKKVKGKRK